MVKILLVEDEKPIQEMVKFSLSMRKMEVNCLSSVADAWYELTNNDCIDCVIIDWMLPDKSGLDLVRKIRKDKCIHDLPIIMLTAKSTEKNKLLGFDAGVDDYVTKPFSPKELVVRIKALLNRSHRYKENNGNIVFDKSNDILIHENLSIDCSKHEVLVSNKLISLGPVEFKLLVYLLKNKNTVCSREKLMDKVWAGKETLTDRTVDVHIRRVRKALEGTGMDKKIKTIRSFGYIFK